MKRYYLFEYDPPQEAVILFTKISPFHKDFLLILIVFINNILLLLFMLIYLLLDFILKKKDYNKYFYKSLFL